MLNIEDDRISYYMYKIGKAEHFVRMMEWKKLLEFLDPKKGEKILDIACGKGMLSLRIAKKGCEVYGIDLSDVAINQAKYISEQDAIKNCDFMVGNAEKLPYPNDYFDKIVCSSALEHFDNDLMALKEMDRVLKDKGILSISMDSLTYPIDDELKETHSKLYHVINYYKYENIESKLDKTSLKIDKFNFCINSRFTSYLYNLFFIKNYKQLEKDNTKERASLKNFAFLLVSLILFPLCLASDKLFGNSENGYTILLKCSKKNK